MMGWFERACRETDTMARIGLCDLAVHDLAAIERHYANKTDSQSSHRFPILLCAAGDPQSGGHLGHPGSGRAAAGPGV
jgi:hypothetical protein